MSRREDSADGSSFEDVPCLVTGGAGFIGSHLVDALVARGARVRVLDDLSTGRRENLAAHLGEHLDDGAVEMLQGDIRDGELAARACDGVRVVFHQAALGSVPRSMKDPATSVDVNVGGTARIFSAARGAGVERIVYASSSSVYGDSDRLPKREGEEGEPLSPYALSKHVDEELAAVFARCFDLEIVGLRYFNVYGPRQRPDGPYAAVVPLFVDAILHGRSPTIHGDGRQSRDFTWVGDAVAANLQAASAPASACGRSYNVAGGRRVNLLELVAAVRDAVVEHTGRRELGEIEPRHGPPRPGDPRHSEADLDAARRHLGYSPSVGVEEGLRRTVASFAAAAPLGDGGSSR